MKTSDEELQSHVTTLLLWRPQTVEGERNQSLLLICNVICLTLGEEGITFQINYNYKFRNNSIEQRKNSRFLILTVLKILLWIVIKNTNYKYA